MPSQLERQITGEIVESVMNDLLAGQVAIVKSLKAETQDGYMLALRNLTRGALVKAFDGRQILTDKQLDAIHSDGFRQGLGPEPFA
jgi:hypothetical protein